jgi:hypothetical protein
MILAWPALLLLVRSFGAITSFTLDNSRCSEAGDGLQAVAKQAEGRQGCKVL